MSMSFFVVRAMTRSLNDGEGPQRRACVSNMSYLSCLDEKGELCKSVL